MTAKNYHERWPNLLKTELVTLSEIAKMTGVTPACASNWVSRYQTFPAPLIVNRDGTLALWAARDVQAWFDATLANRPKSSVKRGVKRS